MPSPPLPEPTQRHGSIRTGLDLCEDENEIQEEVVDESEQFEQNNNEVLTNNLATEETIAEENQSVEEPEVSNGLENFEIEEETPELFNSESEDNLINETSETKETDNLEEDDLEIPAFLRRQKN